MLVSRRGVVVRLPASGLIPEIFYGANLLHLVGDVSRPEASNDSDCLVADGLSFSMDRRMPLLLISKKICYRVNRRSQYDE
jgi:hypothetical protein